MLELKLEQFHGPLSLLMQLIEKEELDITQLSLARVADQFIAYIRQSGCISPGEMADFLVVAAKLLLIKSRALLPYLYPEEEEEIADLERQLKMYKEFIEAAKLIEKRLGKKKFMFVREFNRQAVLSGTHIFSPPKKISKEDLAGVFAELLTTLKPAERMEEAVLTKKVNIEDKILRIQALLLERIRVSFNRVLEQAQDKTEIIVSFLAMLEMMRQREVVLEQEGLFAEIFINRT